MKEVIERCNWLINKCNDKAITPDVKDDFRYLLEEIERQKEIIKQLDIKNLELTTIIKEVREYVHWRLDDRQDMYITQMRELLEILDKEKE